MMQRWRCFVAVPVPDDLCRRLQVAVEAWRAEPISSDLRWTDPAGWHLTLAFLGSVPVEGLDPIQACIAEVAAGGQPGIVSGGGLGVFPRPTRARVLWYGIADPQGILDRLATGLREALVPLTPRLEGEKPFTGHVTLARARAERGIDMSAWLMAHAAPTGEVPVDRLILYRSHLGGRGPAQYEALGLATLGGSGWAAGDVGAEASVHG
jgi:RNA 2',3'-cyclic 3'-phosphodiesterase